MAQWPNFIERQLLNALNRASTGGGRFDKDTAEQLWVWQGKCRVDIKEALTMEVPMVYGPPKAKIVRGSTDHPEKGQLWHVETENDNLIEVHMQTPPPIIDQSSRYLLHVTDQIDRESHQAFCKKSSAMGLGVVSYPLRNAGTQESIAELAEIYLGMGRCYGGASAMDLLRVTDHMEQLFNIEGEPLILMVSGLAIVPGLAFAAIDQRISGVIVDFRSAPATVIQPTGFPPLLKEQYVHLGANPLLTIMQCVAARPMMLIGTIEEAKEPWIKNAKSGVLSFADQIKAVEELYVSQHAGEQLTIVGLEEFEGDEARWVRKMMEFFPGVAD
jgi:hypothetical protein